MGVTFTLLKICGQSIDKNIHSLLTYVLFNDTVYSSDYAKSTDTIINAYCIASEVQGSSRGFK
jgi:hypothetical protein